MATRARGETAQRTTQPTKRKKKYESQLRVSYLVYTLLNLPKQRLHPIPYAICLHSHTHIATCSVNTCGVTPQADVYAPKVDIERREIVGWYSWRVVYRGWEGSRGTFDHFNKAETAPIRIAIISF